MKSSKPYRRSRNSSERPPELLYHSMDKQRFDRMVLKEHFFYPNQRSIFASKIMGYAWQVAHRTCDHPQVAIIDVLSTRQHNIRFRKNKRNLWEVDSVPTSCILNAHTHFAEQISAGGIPYVIENGVYKVALIKMRRTHFDSWEIAKGKLEIGETPLQAARREIQEEMGVFMGLSSPIYLGIANFSLRTPAQHPRLKTLHVYLFKAQEQSREFNVATDEGIVEVQWFDVETALKLVSYRSLGHIMYQMKKQLLKQGEAALGSRSQSPQPNQNRLD